MRSVRKGTDNQIFIYVLTKLFLGDTLTRALYFMFGPGLVLDPNFGLESEKVLIWVNQEVMIFLSLLMDHGIVVSLKLNEVV